MNHLDSLVEQIASRVKDRLNSKLPPSPNYDIFKKRDFSQSIQEKTMKKFKDPKELAKYIDHTLLKPDATKAQLEKLCREAVEHSFATVCVNSSNIPTVKKFLQGSSVKPIAVVGFPLGAATTAAKVFEAEEAIREGALEIDMVMNIGALKSKNYETVFYDIQKVVEACRTIPVKVILETSMLDTQEKMIACVLAKLARASFVKTSTGFGGGGATVEDIELMRNIVGGDMGVKASGGIRTFEDAVKMIEAGANRIGSSNSVAMVTGKAKRWQF